jgi:hypothetical protein
MLRQERIDQLKNAAEAGGIAGLVKGICDLVFDDDEK